MANLNKVMLIGNLTRDPELRYTPKGSAVAEFGLAINRVWYNEQKQKQEETTFVDITLWARQAEIAQQYLTKGSPVYIEGRLSLDTWDVPLAGIAVPQGASYLPLCIGGALIALFAADLLLRAPDLRPEGS
jgi:single-strand DNA-binding protein